MSDGSVQNLSGDEIAELSSNLPDSPLRIKFQHFISKVTGKEIPTYDQLQELHVKTGHTSTNRLFEVAWREGYFSEKMRGYCQKITSTCIHCVMFNIKKNGFAPLRTQCSDVPWKEIHLDWIFFPGETAHKCLVIKDICTGLLVLFKYKIKHDEDSASGNRRLAQKLFKIFAHYGVPQVIKTDADQGYGNLLTKNLAKSFN